MLQDVRSDESVGGDGYLYSICGGRRQGSLREFAQSFVFDTRSAGNRAVILTKLETMITSIKVMKKKCKNGARSLLNCRTLCFTVCLCQYPGFSSYAFLICLFFFAK